jgi:hypothetical protein
LRSKAAVLQRFDGTTWRDVARYPTTRDADAALDHAIGDGDEPGALRIVNGAPSTTARALMIAGAAVCVAVAIAIVWIFVAAT